MNASYPSTGQPVPTIAADLCCSLQNGATASSQCENVGALDISKLTAVSFAAMRLEIGSWQVGLKSGSCLLCTLFSTHYSVRAFGRG